MREILDGLFTWAWYSEKFRYDFNGHLVLHPAGNLCIDPVETSDAVIDEIARRGVSRILLTNRNHFRASARLRERTGARVAVHPADASFVRDKGVTVDEALAVGQSVGPFVVIDASGKSPGEIALHAVDRRLLIVGDACVGKVPGELALLPEAVMDHPARLRQSLRCIAAEAEFDTLLVGDGHSILSGAKAALQRLVSGFDD
jgi:glyoxylase-like metal-dependent hydrolase (beta-lactamase superfamily II)